MTKQQLVFAFMFFFSLVTSSAHASAEHSEDNHHKKVLEAHQDLHPFFESYTEAKGDNFIPQEVLLKLLKPHLTKVSVEYFQVVISAMYSPRTLKIFFTDHPKGCETATYMIKIANLAGLCLLADVMEYAEDKKLTEDERTRKQLEKLYVQFVNPGHRATLQKAWEQTLAEADDVKVSVNDHRQQSKMFFAIAERTEEEQAREPVLEKAYGHVRKLIAQKRVIVSLEREASLYKGFIDFAETHIPSYL